MNNLEEYIRKNSATFHKASLPEGHENRFMDKLDAEKQIVKSSWRHIIFRVAAVVLLALGGVAMLYFGEQHHQKTLEARLPLEIKEAESYYLAKCDEQLSHFKTYHSTTSPIDIAEQLEKLEKEYKKLKQQMAQQSGNKRVMAALVQNLQLRLQLLEQINRLMEKEEPQIIAI